MSATSQNQAPFAERNADFEHRILGRRRTQQATRNEWPKLRKALWLVLPIAVIALDTEVYVVRELLVAWLLFSVFFVAGAVFVVAAFLVGHAVDSAILWAQAEFHRIHWKANLSRIARNDCLAALVPLNNNEERGTPVL